MTEEQKKELEDIWNNDMSNAIDFSIQGNEVKSNLCQLNAAKNVIKWLDKNMFDYRGLIPLGLAKDMRLLL